MRGGEKLMTHEESSERKPRSWEPLEVTDVGHVGEILQGGGGKLSATASDSGDIRKPSGQA
jgi:hypothetical protein